MLQHHMVITTVVSFVYVHHIRNTHNCFANAMSLMQQLRLTQFLYHNGWNLFLLWYSGFYCDERKLPEFFKYLGWCRFWYGCSSCKHAIGLKSLHGTTIASTSNYGQFCQIPSKTCEGNTTKVRSCYRVSITSNPADQIFFIRSKNNNKIAGKWDC